jgi:acetate kinase
VHGGPDYVHPTLVTPPVQDALKALTPLDPVHMPATLRAMQAVTVLDPNLPQVACFDTAFHHTQPDVATRLAIPRALSDQGVRRYGFHGLSYEYISGRLKTEAPALAAGRTVVAHLGSGDSLCALQGGRSVATTTGFSTLDGLVMATRCGALDPGVIFYLAREGRSLVDIEAMLFDQSGLLGVSGLSGDMRVLLASADPHARQALDLFIYRIACDTAAMATAMGGIDGLVFTAGIGQHAPEIRAEVCRRLVWLGVVLDDAANLRGDALISSADSRVVVGVMTTDEEAMIARHTRATLDHVAEKDQP